MSYIKKAIDVFKKEGVKGVFKIIYTKYNNEEKKEYYRWIKLNSPSKKELKEQRVYKFEENPKISIVVPLYNTPKKYLLELIRAVQKQTYSNWELCLADGSTKPLHFLDNIIKKEKRIKYKVLEENRGISGNTNEALKFATGDFIALLDHDDLIPLNSLYEIAKAINENKGVDYIFTDEDKFTDINKKTRYEPNFKPDYSFDTFTSYNYICHFSIFKKELIDKIGGFRDEFDGSQDYDLILRAVENSKKIVHIPKILYHWRVHPNSTAGNAESKPYCYDAGKRAVAEHLVRKGFNQARAEYGIAIVRNRVIYEIKKREEVAMLLYLQDNRLDLKKLKKDIEQMTYKKFSIILFVTKEIADKEEYKDLIKLDKIIVKKIIEKEDIIQEFNNEIQEISTDQILFVKDIQDIKTKDFIEQLLGFMQRGDVGVISPRIIYKYTSSQYNGTVYGIDREKIGYIDYIDVAGSFGYITRGAVVQNYSIIKSECIMTSKNNIELANYLDSTMDYEDAIADLSFKLFKKENKLNVINPHIELEALEITQKTGENKFYKKWELELDKPDPNYNVNLRYEKNNLFKVKQEKVNI